MPDGQKHAEPILGLQPPASTGWTGIETLAAAATGLWLVLVLLTWLLLSLFGGDGDPLRPVLAAIAIVMPVGLIWTAARAIRAERIARDETRRLQLAVAALRQSLLADRQGRLQPAAPQPPAQAAAAPRTTALPLEDQPRLSLEGGSEQDASPPSTDDFIRALHFPDDAADAEGFAALHRALQDRPTRQLIQASQDVLTLLSQDGIYMDDLAPEPAQHALWRRFARGDRGGDIAGLAAGGEGSALAIASARLREDAIFRDAAHHFLRLFDRHLALFADRASDDELARLTRTRSARSFILLGHAAGIFD
jgi:hypothetical protein